MTKEDIATRLIELNGGYAWASLNKVMKLTRLGHDKCRVLVSDLTPTAGPNHGGKVTQLYFLDDVADAIMRKGLGNGEN